MTYQVSKRKVPHAGPLGADILLLGEAPLEEEDAVLQPFYGRSGSFLDHILLKQGIDRSTCRVGNVLNYRPHNNEFKYANGSPQLDESIRELTTYLNEYPPKLIIAFGNEALKFLMGFDKISHWRGSVLQRGTSYIVPTYHPAAALRDGSLSPQIAHDIERAVDVLNNGYVEPPTYFYDDVQDVDEHLPSLLSAPYISADIEAIEGTTHVLCMAFAWSSTDSLCIRNKAPIGQLDENFKRQVQKVLNACPDITFQNGTYDWEVLRINDIHVPLSTLKHDTILAQRIIAPELPIGLAFLTSIYTTRPYYKDEGKQVGKKIPLTLYRYCCMDTVVTWEVRQKQSEIFAEDPRLSWSFQEEMADLPVALEFQKNGLLIDKDRLKQFDDKFSHELEQNTENLFMMAGWRFNPNSPKQVPELLYNKLGFPKRTKKGGKVTTDEGALMSLLQYSKREYETKKTDAGREQWIKKMATLKFLLMVREGQKMISSYLRMKICNDGRVRSSYHPSGTETGRWSCSNYVDGSGFNAQTPPRTEISLDV